MIPFLSLKDVTGLREDEIQDAVARVVSSGWYLQGEENRRFEEAYSAFIGTLLERSIRWPVRMAWTP